MTETTMQPTKWRYEEATKTIRSVPENYWIATMDSWDGAVDHQANAKLIASAPEMFARIQELEANATYKGNGHVLYRFLKNLIDKFKG